MEFPCGGIGVVVCDVHPDPAEEEVEQLVQIVELVRQRLDRIGVEQDRDQNIDVLVDLYRQRVSTVNQLADSILYCFQDFDDYDPKAAAKVLKPGALEPLQQLQAGLEPLNQWNAASIHAVIEDVTARLEVGMSKVGQPLRVAVTGGSFSPPIDQTVELVGKDRSIRRIKRAIDYISANID